MRTEYWDRDEKLRLLGPGIWMDEPDEVEWDSEEWRMPCLVLRAPELGVLCGYVGVAPAHPWHGLHWGQLDRLDELSGHRISWSAPRDHLRVTRTDPTVAHHWYLGFHTAHAFDLQPAIRQTVRTSGLPLGPVLEAHYAEPILIASVHGTPILEDTYKDFVWVRGRVEELAEQARKAGHS